MELNDIQINMLREELKNIQNIFLKIKYKNVPNDVVLFTTSTYEDLRFDLRSDKVKKLQKQSDQMYSKDAAHNSNIESIKKLKKQFLTTNVTYEAEVKDFIVEIIQDLEKYYLEVKPNSYFDILNIEFRYGELIVLEGVGASLVRYENQESYFEMKLKFWRNVTNFFSWKLDQVERQNI